jgi:hypothetical protein
VFCAFGLSGPTKENGPTNPSRYTEARVVPFVSRVLSPGNSGKGGLRHVRIFREALLQNAAPQRRRCEDGSPMGRRLRAEVAHPDAKGVPVCNTQRPSIPASLACSGLGRHASPNTFTGECSPKLKKRAAFSHRISEPMDTDSSEATLPVAGRDSSNLSPRAQMAQMRSPCSGRHVFQCYTPHLYLHGNKPPKKGGIVDRINFRIFWIFGGPFIGLDSLLRSHVT